MSLPRALHRAGDRFATLDQCKKSKQKKRQTYKTHKYNFFTGNKTGLRPKSPFRPTISAPIMTEGQAIVFFLSKHLTSSKILN